MPSATKKLGIYVHVPFCRGKCEYCDFYSLGGGKNRDAMDRYLKAVTAHIRETAPLAPHYEVDTVYFGGGTPSFFGAEGLIRVLDEVVRGFHMAKSPEITLEANPDSATMQTLSRLGRSGFNRISIGVQSDDDEMLRKLGRPHDYKQATAAIANARRAGFENVSVDLMYGLPNQSLDRWRETLRTVAALSPDHVSCYALKVEEGTRLWEYREYANFPDDDTQADMYLAAEGILRQNGLKQYEISNFARPGYESRHNLKYWLGGEYLGFGPSAASDFGGKRFTIARDLEGYIRGVSEQGVVLSECETIPVRERAGEYLMLRLRTTHGIEQAEYEKTFLLPFAPLEKLMQKFEKAEMAEKTESGRWRLTPKGFLVSNSVIVELLETQQRTTPLAKKR
ncbi:MAG: radical SAM family heme chaperone HemW [Oscillospiraceae bacterium]|nr:radical SAM family heme chaperone HemW [Oscillospiraceae bacterium]